MQHRNITTDEQIQTVHPVDNVDAMESLDLFLFDSFHEYPAFADDHPALLSDTFHRVQRDLHLRDETIQHYRWPCSFPQCTSTLRHCVDRWINEELVRPNQAKCLILIGEDGKGKTSFAQSLSGMYNYFAGRWDADAYNPYADYSIYEHIPWDQFEALGFPDKELLFGQPGVIHTCDSSGTMMTIDVTQPAIILLRPEEAGSLLDEAVTFDEEQRAAHWKRRALIYNMGSDEGFYPQSAWKPIFHKKQLNCSADDRATELMDVSNECPPMAHPDDKNFGTSNDVSRAMVDAMDLSDSFEDVLSPLILDDMLGMDTTSTFNLYTDEAHSTISMCENAIDTNPRSSTAKLFVQRFNQLSALNVVRIEAFDLHIPQEDDVPKVKFRCDRTSFAIACHTSMAKEKIMKHIQNEFTTALRYVAIASVGDPSSDVSTFYIQIVLQEIIRKKVPFLQAVAGRRCNYQVTGDCRSWQAFLRTLDDRLEFGEFQSVTANRRAKSKTADRPQQPDMSEQDTSVNASSIGDRLNKADCDQRMFTGDEGNPAVSGCPLQTNPTVPSPVILPLYTTAVIASLFLPTIKRTSHQHLTRKRLHRLLPLLPKEKTTTS